MHLGNTSGELREEPGNPLVLELALATGAVSPPAFLFRPQLLSLNKLWAHSVHHNCKGALLPPIQSLPGEFSTLGSSLVLLLSVPRPAGSVPEIKVITVKTYLPCAQHCAKCFTCSIPCNPHKNSERWRC